ncbi:hypothetical protein B0H16DRAFT_1512743 [Mycena metata]|uniref:Uncharacterized protein n=1 Tax=Mycena metata TaxID=1033252 RepID=A0AAD7NRU1_9AGAR|nr:hypothetical protein B0H16DRAFT_1512743 [Mycena metata]
MSESPPWVNLAGLAVGGPLYGIYFSLHVASTVLVLRRSEGPRAVPLYRSVIFVLGWLLFMSVTANWAVTVWHNVAGFIVFKSGTAAPEFFNDSSQITSLVQNIFVAISIVLGDTMIIYRLWIVWFRNKYVVILPTLSLIGLFITTVLSVQTASHVNNLAEIVGLTPTLVFTLFTNVYSTAFIAYKLWTIIKESSSVGGNQLLNFLSISVESAALYSAWGIFYIVTHQINSDVQIVALMPVPAVAGIANALIQTWSGLGKAIQTRLGSSSRTISATEVRFRTATDTEAGSRTDAVELKPTTSSNGF